MKIKLKNMMHFSYQKIILKVFLFLENPILLRIVISSITFILVFTYKSFFVVNTVLCQPLDEIQWQIDLMLIKQKKIEMQDPIFSSFDNFKDYVNQSTIYRSRNSYLRYLELITKSLEFTEFQKMDNNRANQLYVLRYLTNMEDYFTIKEKDLFVGDYLSHESQLALRGLSQRIIESTDDNSFWILIEDLEFIGRHTKDPLTQHYVAYISSLNPSFDTQENPFYLNITFDHQIYQEYLLYCKNNLV